MLSARVFFVCLAIVLALGGILGAGLWVFGPLALIGLAVISLAVAALL